MPALVWCGRRWMAGSDDFVFGSFLHAIFNVIGALIWFFHSSADTLSRDCTAIVAGDTLPAILTVLMGTQFIAAGVFTFLAFVSGRGRILEPSRRGLVPILLYSSLCVEMMLLGVSCLAVHKVYTEHEASTCIPSTKIVLQGLTVCNLLTSLWFFISICMFFDPAGGRSFGSQEEYHALWEKRCKIMCWCFLGNSHTARGAYTDAAKNLTLLFQGLDLVPTDIMAGFLLVQGYQERVARRRLRGFSYPSDPLSLQEGNSSNTRSTAGGSSNTSRDTDELIRDVDSHQATPTSATPGGGFNGQQQTRRRVRISAQARTFHRYSPDQVQTLEKIEHYAKFYMGAYGWMLYLYTRIICGLPALCIEDPTACCRERTGAHVGDCCMCNNTALHKVAGLRDKDIILTHFKNDLYSPSFYVAEDVTSPEPTIVIAIRGTMSMQDVLTDGVASPAHMDVEGVPDALVHSGMLKSAINIKAAIDSHVDLARDWLPTHKLVIVGHSLGAGSAIILTVLLREFFKKQSDQVGLVDKITCVGYAPPAAVLSRSLAEATRPYVIGCFMGKDLVPRLSSHAIHSLRESLLTALATSEKSKSMTLFHCCCPEKGSLLSEEFDASFEEQAQLRRYQTSKIRVDQRGSQTHVTAASPSSSSQFGTVTSSAGGFGSGGSSSQDFGAAPQMSMSSAGDPATPFGGRPRDEEGKLLKIDPKDLTEDGIVKMFPPAHIIHYAKAETDLCADPCCGKCMGGCHPCNTAHYCPCWISIDDLQEIICSPYMVADHMPDRFWVTLLKARDERLEGKLDKYMFDDAPQGEQRYNFSQPLHYGQPRKTKSPVAGTDHTVL